MKYSCFLKGSLLDTTFSLISISFIEIRLLLRQNLYSSFSVSSKFIIFMYDFNLFFKCFNLEFLTFAHLNQLLKVNFCLN